MGLGLGFGLGLGLGPGLGLGLGLGLGVTCAASMRSTRAMPHATPCTAPARSALPALGVGSCAPLVMSSSRWLGLGLGLGLRLGLGIGLGLRSG